jgi:hypothetical protein
MKTIKRLWMPAVLGVLLVAALVGVAAARPNARPLGQTWRVLAVTPHACVPDEESMDWNFGLGLLECDTAPCRFYCAIDFPAAGEQAVGAVSVKRLTLFAFDNTDAGAAVDGVLHKAYGPTGGNQKMAEASTADSTADPQTVMDTSIDYNPIYRTQAPYLLIRLEHVSFKVYGLHIHYTW